MNIFGFSSKFLIMSAFITDKAVGRALFTAQFKCLTPSVSIYVPLSETKGAHTIEISASAFCLKSIEIKVPF